MSLQMRSFIVLMLVCLMALSERLQADIVVAERYINFADPASPKSPIPDDLPVPQSCELPSAPGELFPGYLDDPQTVHTYHVYYEPETSRILRLAFMGSHAVESPESLRFTWKTWYQVSNDGGKTLGELRPIIQRGDEYTLLHPVEPVYVGKNGFVPSTAAPIRASNGEVMVPFYYLRLDPQGKPFNPLGTTSVTSGGVLIGTWTTDGTDLDWQLGEVVELSPSESTRGVDEPTIVELRQRGAFLMIIRASNAQAEDKVSGYAYYSVSRDFCRTWSRPRPFTYASGKHFFSPSAPSQLVRSTKNGKLYWIGNLAPSQTDGNSPRYPLVIGEIDEEALGLIQESIVVIDDRNGTYDSPKVQLSNFTTVQDPKTGQIVVRLQRIDPAWGDDRVIEFPHCAYVIDVE